MSPKALFTEHAIEALRRPEIRFPLSADKIASILNSGHTIPIGKEQRTHRIHHLFYDAQNQYTFIAVQDEKTGEVVTVFPVDYENKWKVSLDAVDAARRLVVGPPERAADTVQRKTAEIGSIKNPRPFHFRCNFRLVKTGKSASVNLGTFMMDVEQTPHRVFVEELLSRRPDIRSRILGRIKEWIPTGAYDKILKARCDGGGAWEIIGEFFSGES